MRKEVLGLLSMVILFSCQEVKKEFQNEPVEVAPVTDELSIDYKSLGMDTTTIPKGLIVGDEAPNVPLTTSENKKVTLKDFYEKQPVVVIFYRGYWCPICNKYLTEFAEKATRIEDAGAKIIAISSESYENTTKTIAKNKIDFTVISDLDGSIMEAFDVKFDVTKEYQGMIQDKLGASISETNANKEGVLPVPATFIIDTNGKIIYKQFDPDYKNRATIEEILAHLPK
jgi:peroxiredoxin